MRPIVGAELVHEILDVEVDGRFGNAKMIGDLLVAMTIADQPQHIQLAAGQVFVAEMLDQLGRDLR